MAHIRADRVKESSTTTGTGAFTLSGAATGFRAFSAVCATNDTVNYAIVLQGGSEWETGLGTYSSANTLTRTTVYASSNSGSAVNFSAGNKDVFRTLHSIGEITESVYAIADGASVNIDPKNGTIQTWTLGANRTPTASNFLAGQSVTLMVDDGSAYAITWSTINPTWVGGSAPTLATSGYTIIQLWKVGTTVYAALVGKP